MRWDGRWDVPCMGLSMGCWDELRDIVHPMECPVGIWDIPWAASLAIPWNIPSFTPCDIVWRGVHKEYPVGRPLGHPMGCIIPRWCTMVRPIGCSTGSTGTTHGTAYWTVHSTYHGVYYEQFMGCPMNHPIGRRVPMGCPAGWYSCMISHATSHRPCYVKARKCWSHTVRWKAKRLNNMASLHTRKKNFKTRLHMVLENRLEKNLKRNSTIECKSASNIAAS